MGRPYVRAEERIGQRVGKVVVRRLLKRTPGGELWEVKCDCGRIVQKWNTRLFYGVNGNAVNCGCSDPRKVPWSNAAQAYWRRNVASDCVPEWRDMGRWFSECWSLRTEDEPHLVRHDQSKPHGPDNSFWFPEIESRCALIQAAIEYLISKGHSEDAAIDRAYSVSRQRLWQLVKMANGCCQECGRPRGTRSVSKCHRCLDKEYASRKTHRHKERA